MNTTAPANVVPFKPLLEVLTEEVSASRLRLFAGCRLAFYFRYVAQLKKPATPALYVGKTVHSVLQAWNLARWRGHVMDTDTLKEVFTQRWDEDQFDQDIAWDGEEQNERQGAWRLLELYLKETPIPPEEKPVGVEVRLEANLGEHGLPTLIGIVDLVRPGGKIVDFKTSSQTPNPERVAHQSEIQLSCYALLYRDGTGQTESGFELHHLVKTKVPKLVVTEIPSITENQKSRLFKQIESYVDGLQRENFVPSPGIQCLACQFINECRLWH